jgi:hypothetical protein
MSEPKRLFHHRAEVTDGSGVIGGKSCYRVQTVTVLAENDTNLCIDDVVYTTLSKKAGSSYARVGVPNISAYASDPVWGNRVFYSLYTEKRVRESTIESQIQTFIRTKFGFFLCGVDLSCIQDQT